MTIGTFVRKKRIALTRVYVAGLSFLVIFSESYWEDVFLISDIIFLLGILLVAIATVGRLWCSLYISGYKSDTLITVGPYSMCRNPLYFFSFLGGLGVGLADEGLVVAFLIVIGFLLYYPFVIKAEEQQLHRLHKEAFAVYVKKTPRVIPSFGLLNEPEEYRVKPMIFRKRLVDSLCFVWIVGIMEIIEALREYGLIPVLLKLY